MKMDDKYIDLLLNKCTKINESDSMLIYYSKEIESFVLKIVDKVKRIGINDIYLDSYDINDEHNFLLNYDNDYIISSKRFDKSIWDEYAKRHACFLILETEYPGVMDDVDASKISLVSKIKRESHPIYRKMVDKCELSWCIAAYPGEVWARDVFPDDNDCYVKLKNAIYRMCMVDRDNPIDSWDKHLNNIGKIENYLNNLKLEKLHYYNSLGTDLYIYLPNGYLYASALDNGIMVNMPSYEVFASPLYNKTEGIVYASRPLMYQGAKINDFWLRFHDGKVVDYDAGVGKDVLKGIIESDSNSCYLGECALVEKNSPIALENVIYGTTLIDENASCHLALGAGFAECINGGLELGDKELLERGINVSLNHVDFMIGTDDLMIDGITYDGEVIKIFNDGHFDDEIKEEIGYVN